MEASVARGESLTESQVLGQHDYVFEVILLGDSAVGKTSLLRRFVLNKFHFETTTTIGIGCRNRKVTICSDVIKASIKDTAGQEKFRSITQGFYRHVHGVLLVYSIENKKSFDHLQYWMAELKSYADPNVVIMLVGNKCDRERFREVSKKEALTFANDYAMSFYETSAKESIDVDVAFTNILKEIYNKRDVLKISKVSQRRQAAEVKVSCC